MPQIVHAEFEFKHLVYLFFFVLWIAGQIAESNRKKKLRQANDAAARSAKPQSPPDGQPAEAPLDNDLKRLLEQLTGQPASTPPPPRTAPPPPLPANATMDQLRGQAQRLKTNVRQAQTARPQKAPPRPAANPRHENYEVARATPTAAPSPVAAASISVAYKDLNVRDRHMHTPPLRAAPSSPMRATADAQRLAWVRNPQTLRQIMVARVLLDPPKALEGQPR